MIDVTELSGGEERDRICWYLKRSLKSWEYMAENGADDWHVRSLSALIAGMEKSNHWKGADLEYIHRD